MPEIILMVTLLPAPLSPHKAVTSPAGSRDRLRLSARTGPKASGHPTQLEQRLPPLEQSSQAFVQPPLRRPLQGRTEGRPHLTRPWRQGHGSPSNNLTPMLLGFTLNRPIAGFSTCEAPGPVHPDPGARCVNPN